MKELAVLAAAILIAYLLVASLPAITDLSPEEMQIERRSDAFISMQGNDQVSEDRHDMKIQSVLSCN